MKRWLRLVTALLCLCLLLSAAPMAMAATTTGSEYGPMLTSPLNAEQKQTLLASLYEGDIVSTRDAIMEGLISCQEVTAYYMSRIDEYADPYNCFITVCDNAMEEARKRDAELVAGTAKGDLFGVPIVVKDNIRYEGYPTTNGDKGLLRKKSTSNATVVDRLLKDGAVILGKTNMCYYAYYAGHSSSTAGGVTKNAYSTYLAPGGSSGGSAVAVSLNFGLAGLGTDTGSSLRLPAVLNGCYSMRVTHGSISRNGITTLVASRDVPGAITRSVEDMALMLDSMSGDTNFYKNLDGNALQGAKFAVIKELSGPTNLSTNNSPRTAKNVDDEVEAAFWNAVEELKACGAEVITISYRSIFNTNSASKRTGLKNLLDKYDLDGFLFPTYLHKPQRIGKDANGKNWSTKTQVFINNCHHVSPPTGWPEIAIPIGYHSNGAGIGMEIAAYKNHDQQLLNYAYSYQLRYDHRVLPTGAPNEYADEQTGSMQEVVAQLQETLDPTWSYTKTEEGITITACNDGDSSTIVVPAELEGEAVTAIAESAFTGCANAQTILIPGCVKKVNLNAFSGCQKLTKIGYGGNKEAWDAFGIVTNASVTCDYAIEGDYNADMRITEADAVEMLRGTLFGEANTTGKSAEYSEVLQLYWKTLTPENISLENAAQ